jgi:hypothetical protein
MSENKESVATAAPGWYQSSEHATGILRYWDGHQWTDQYHDGRPAQPIPAQINQTVVVQAERRKKVNHVLHFILTLCTFGLWLPVWFIVAVAKN